MTEASLPEPEPEPKPEPKFARLPAGVRAVRPGPGANCSSAGSAIDVLFYGSVIIGAVAVALAAAFPPRDPRDEDPRDEEAAADMAATKANDGEPKS